MIQLIVWEKTNKRLTPLWDFGLILKYLFCYNSCDKVMRSGVVHNYLFIVINPSKAFKIASGPMVNSLFIML